MPMQLNVGLSQKIGQPDFGSRGASANFEVELESNLIQEPDQLREKIRFLFALAKEAVEEELNGRIAHETNGSSTNGNGSQRPANGRLATASQVRAIHAIADRHHIDLPERLRKLFGADNPNTMLLGQASELIDNLKANSNAQKPIPNGQAMPMPVIRTSCTEFILRGEAAEQ
jgi:hypothetical protein